MSLSLRSGDATARSACRYHWVAAGAPLSLPLKPTSVHLNRKRFYQALQEHMKLQALQEKPWDVQVQFFDDGSDARHCKELALKQQNQIQSLTFLEIRHCRIFARK